MKQLWTNWTKTDVRNILAVVSLLATILLMLVLLFYPVPARNTDLVNIAMGYFLGQATGSVFGFYFGASKHEIDKDRKDA
jgi:hypothetical protein